MDDIDMNITQNWMEDKYFRPLYTSCLEGPYKTEYNENELDYSVFYFHFHYELSNN